MAKDGAQVRLAPDGKVYVGPVGSTLPTNATMAVNAALSDLGYISEDGVALTPGVDINDVMMWQSAVPVKRTLDTASFEVKFSMGQVNKATWGLYFFNNSAWANNFGQAKLTLLSNPGTQDCALIIEWVDDEADQCRLVLPKATLTDRDDLQLTRTDPVLSGVTFSALDFNGVFGYVYSDNPDLVPTS